MSKEIQYAGFDVFWGNDNKVWILISQIQETGAASVINHYEEIGNNLRMLFLSELSEDRARWFCYFRGLSKQSLYGEVIEYQEKDGKLMRSSQSLTQETIDYIATKETWLNVPLNAYNQQYFRNKDQ